MAPRPYSGVYEGMDFPDYEFREFPKMLGYTIVGNENVPVIVQNAEEEKKVRDAGGLSVSPLDVAQAKVTAAEAEKAALEAKVAELQAKLAAQQPQAKPSTPPAK